MAAPRRRIFVGDVQGCRVELERLLETLRFDPAADALFPVGDLVNRGPDSLGCLRLLSRLGAASVLGNHDLHLLSRATGRRAASERDSLEDVLAAEDRAELLGWLASQPFVRVLDDVVCVHGGLSPRWRRLEDLPAALLEAGERPLEAPLELGPEARFVVGVRRCDASGEPAPGGAPEEDARYRPWHAFLAPDGFAGRRVVYGHWAVQGLRVERAAIGLDSGCVWGGALSAWIAEEDRVVQVPAERAHARIR